MIGISLASAHAQDPGSGEHETRVKQAQAAVKEGRWNDARTAYEKCLELRPEDASTAYELACVHARLSEVDQALEWLERALEWGFSDRGSLLSHPDLHPLRESDRFSKIVDTLLGKETARLRQAALDARAVAGRRERLRDEIPIDFAPSPSTLAWENCLSDDGKRLIALGSEDAYLIEISTMEILATLRGHDAPYRASFLLGGERVLSMGASDAELRLFDGRAGDLLASIGDEHQFVLCVAVHPDGELFAIGTLDGKVELRDATAGNVRFTHLLGTAPIGLHFSPTGDLLVAADAAGTIALIEVGEHTARNLGRRNRAIRRIAFSTNEDRLLIELGPPGPSYTSASFAIPSGDPGPVIPQSFDWSPDGSLVCAASGGSLALVDVASGATISVLLPLSEANTLDETAHFTADGTTLVVETANGLVAFDVPHGNRLGMCDNHGHWSLRSDRICVVSNTEESFRSVLESFRGKQYLKRSLEILDPRSMRSLGVFPCLFWTPLWTRPLLLVTDRNPAGPLGPLSLCDLETGLPLGQLEGDWPVRENVSGRATDRHIVASLFESHSGSVMAWDRATRKLIGELSTRALPTQCIASLSPTEVVLVYPDGTARLWNTRTGNTGARLQPGSAQSAPLGIHLVTSPDHTSALLSSYGADSADLIDTAQWRVIQRLPGRFVHYLQLGNHIAQVNGPKPFALCDRGYFVLSQDKAATVWDREGRKVSDLVGHEREITFTAFDPTGTHVATVSADDQTGRIWDAVSGHCERVLTFAIKLPCQLAFSSTGPYLSVVGTNAAELWQWQRGERIATIPASHPPTGHENPQGGLYEGADSIVLYQMPGVGGFDATAFSADGRRLFIDQRATVTLVDAMTGQVIRRLDGSQAQFSPDGGTLVTTDGNRSWLSNAEDGSVRATLEGSIDARHESPFSQDGTQVLTMLPSGTLVVWDAVTGKQKFHLDAHVDQVDLAFFTDADRRIVSVGPDDSVRLWDAATGQLLLTRVEYQDGEWLAFTPSLHYLASEKGDQWAYVSVGNASYPLSAYSRLLKDERAVQSWLEGNPQPRVVLPSAPDIEVISPVGDVATIHDRTCLIEARAHDRYGIERFEVVQDGADVPVELHNGGRESWLKQTVTVPEERAETEVSVRAVNVRGVASRTSRVRLQYVPHMQDLYAVAIAVQDYQADELDLKYAVKDADDLLAVLRKQEGVLFRKVHEARLTDGEVTAGALKRLRSEFLRQAQPEDMIVVLAAGHGVRTDAGEYYFLTRDASPSSPYDAIDRATLESLVTWDKLYARRRVLLIDSCQAGERYDPGARSADRGARPLLSPDEIEQARASAGTGLYVLAATSENAVAREADGNGLFTRALLEGLNGNADANHNGDVEVQELFAYMADRSQKLSQGRQRATLPLVRGGEDFPIARVRR